MKQNRIMHPKHLSIYNFNYDLPAELIAQYPLEQRDSSKLLIYQNENISEDVFFNLDDYLPENTLLIFNNTKVIEARLLFQKLTGGTIEIFCLEPDEQYPDISSSMLQKEKTLWKCLIGGAKKWKEGQLSKTIKIKSKEITLFARQIKKNNDYFLIELSWNDNTFTFAEVLHHAGSIPLPPYLNRETEEKDKITYQTVYAKHDGSIAAPTAGLHFTERLFTKLLQKNIHYQFVTLHVGAGTFKPVKSATMEEHEMHAEFINVSQTAIQNLIDHLDKTIITVGTTSLRTIESLNWMGLKANQSMKIETPESINEKDISIQQWDPYDMNTEDISVKESLQALLYWMKAKQLQNLITKTQIIIAPGYKFKIANGLITNFHQPQSTLLLLVAAIIGDDWKKVYNYAMENNFRFLSYGDGSLLWI
jgi:S-adenosylmethionine:tRNA ribosyltransferase-isomerase